MAIRFLMFELYQFPLAGGGELCWRELCPEASHVVIPAVAVRVPYGNHQTQASLDYFLIADL